MTEINGFDVSQVLASSNRLYSPEQIECAILSQARLINAYYSGSSYVVMPLLNGGLVYSGRILPLLDGDIFVESVKVSRYGARTCGNELVWYAKPDIALDGKRILLLDDIYDQGVSIALVKKYCLEHGAAEVSSAVLALKQFDDELDRGVPDFYALEVPDVFVYGYGMDCKHKLRNAPGIYELPAEFY